MNFSHYYTKLNDRTFTTIRRRFRHKEGEIVDVSVKRHQQFKVEIKKVWRKTLGSLSTTLLCKDTDMPSRGEAIALIQSFYDKPIDVDNEKVYVVKCRRRGSITQGRLSNFVPLVEGNDNGQA